MLVCVLSVVSLAPLCIPATQVTVSAALGSSSASRRQASEGSDGEEENGKRNACQAILKAKLTFPQVPLAFPRFSLFSFLLFVCLIWPTEARSNCRYRNFPVIFSTRVRGDKRARVLVGCCRLHSGPQDRPTQKGNQIINTEEIWRHRRLLLPLKVRKAGFRCPSEPSKT